MATFKETSEREFHIINFIDKSLVTFTPSASTTKLLVKGASVKDSQKRQVYIGLSDGTNYKILINDDYKIYYRTSDSIYISKNTGTPGWPIYINLYKEDIGQTARVRYLYNGVSDYFFTINYIPYEVLFMGIYYSEDIRNVYLFSEKLPSSYSVSPSKHIALYSSASGDLSLYGPYIYYDPMKILGGDEKSIDDYVNEGTITYKSGNDLNANIKSMYTIEVTFVNIPNTNKDTIEISEKTDIYCYEYINNKWQAYGSRSFISPTPLVYKSVAHYQ